MSVIDFPKQVCLCCELYPFFWYFFSTNWVTLRSKLNIGIKYDNAAPMKVTGYFLSNVFSRDFFV